MADTVFNNNTIYSSSEQIIGTTPNGDKVTRIIYQIDTSETRVKPPIPDGFVQLISLSGAVTSYGSASHKYSYPIYWKSDSDCFFVYLDHGSYWQFEIQLGTTWPKRPVHITLVIDYVKSNS